MGKRRLWPAAVLAAFAIFTAACGDDNGDGGGSATGSTGASVSTTTLAPQTGGTIAMGMFSETAGLDPIVSTGNGTTGFIEMAAVYDTIVHWNIQTGKYDNNFAESVVANADSAEWTLKLKPGIKFSDGTDYDAAAVVFGMNRHRSGITGAPACQELYACPRNSTSSSAYMAFVKSMDAVDKLTVKFTLTSAWTSFPYALSAEAGMIPSPTAIKKCDPTKDVRQCEFNLKPVGAGAFKVDTFNAKDTITMSRNPTYFGGQVYLDGVKFVNNINDAGGAKTLEALNTGTLQAAFLRDPATVAAAHDKKYAGVSTVEQAGGIFLLNTGVTVNCSAGKPEPTCAGKPDGATATNPPTKDPKVRQAIAMAIDPKVLNDRGFSGKGLVGNELLQSDFRWYPGVTGPKYDPDGARKLVAELKAAGWDGKVRLLYNSSPTASAVGLAAQTLLQAVGMDASLDVGKDTTAQVNQVGVLKDFDVTGWGISIAPDDGAQWGLTQNLLSTSGSNRVGYKSAIVDQALRDLLTAKTDDEKKALYKKIAEQVAADVPILPFAKIEEFIAWNAKVHGVVQANRAGVYLDKAWIEK
jgi:peptide/nickel transport system substrate-binding protein